MAVKAIEFPAVIKQPPLPGEVKMPETVKASTPEPTLKKAVKTMSSFKYDLNEVAGNPSTPAYESITGTITDTFA